MRLWSSGGRVRREARLGEARLGVKVDIFGGDGMGNGEDAGGE